MSALGRRERFRVCLVGIIMIGLGMIVALLMGHNGHVMTAGCTAITAIVATAFGIGIGKRLAGKE